MPTCFRIVGQITLTCQTPSPFTQRQAKVPQGSRDDVALKMALKAQYFLVERLKIIKNFCLNKLVFYLKNMPCPIPMQTRKISSFSTKKLVCIVNQLLDLKKTNLV